MQRPARVVHPSYSALSPQRVRNGNAAMTSKRKPIHPGVMSLCLLLLALGAASVASATTREVAMHGPNGDGGGECSAPESTAPATARAATDPKATKPAKRAPATRIKPIVPVRGGDDDAAHAPRWHSFLPGMFR